MRAIVMSIVVSMAMTSGCSGEDAPASAVDAMPDTYVCRQVVRLEDPISGGCYNYCTGNSSEPVGLLQCNPDCHDVTEAVCLGHGGCHPAYLLDTSSGSEVRHFLGCRSNGTEYGSGPCDGLDSYSCVHRRGCAMLLTGNPTYGPLMFARCVMAAG